MNLKERESTLNKALLTKKAGFSVHATEIPKNNTVLEGFHVEDENSTVLSPIIYSSPIWEDLTDLELAEKLINIMEESEEINKTAEESVKKLSADFIKENINIYMIQDTPDNRKMLVEKEVVYKEYTNIDLLAFLTITMFQEENSRGTVKVTNSLLDAYSSELAYEELWDIANEKLYDEFTIKNISEIMKNMAELDEDFPEELLEPVPMYVVSNKNNICGSAVILNDEVIEEILTYIHTTRFYVIPSSIHEVIIIPYRSNYNIEELKNMIQEVNNSIVALEERLSDHPYYYDGVILRNS